MYRKPDHEIQEARVKLEELKSKYGFREPDRGDIPKMNVQWRDGRPNYASANYVFLLGKTQNHKEGSLEETVENLVKTWEMEASHFANIEEWTTIDLSNYKVQVNGGNIVDGRVAAEIGNYNALLADCKAYQKYGKLSFENSHRLFQDTLPDGFSWEVLKVLSPPPEVLFSWRHWGYLKQNNNNNDDDNKKLIEMYGLTRVVLNPNLENGLKIQKLEVYYEPESFMGVIEGKVDHKVLLNGKCIIGDVSKTAIEKIDQEESDAECSLN